ncbi:MAG: DNA replication/repair protein RecF [Clostridium sp.]
MLIKELQLVNFRNYENLYITLSEGINVFYGDNAQGKTNILEALYFCSLGKSHRTSKDRELIKWDKDSAYVKLNVERKPLNKKIEMKIFKQCKKGVSINSINIKKLSDLIGVLNVVMFSPEDLKIVKDSPSHRRKFIDMELCKLSKRYLYNLSQYKKVLEERNAALKKLNGELDVLDIYDFQLSKLGSEIIKSRLNYIEMLNDYGEKIHNDISSSKEIIHFNYISSLKKIKDLDVIGDEFLNLLRKNRKKDIDGRITSVGPHRDEFSIEINGIDTRCYGSQGQQRTAVLTIKFASLEIIKKVTGEYPILLLDDVLSELDLNRQRYILSSINKVQTLITCTGIMDINDNIGTNSKVFKVSEGKVEEMVK